MNFVLGARGRLGRTIATAREFEPVVALEREHYADWWRQDAADAVARFFAARTDSGGVVYVAAGLIDPTASVENHERVNFRLPRNVVDGAARAGLKAVTFGTVMDAVVGANSSNPYFASKARFSDFVSGLPQQSRALHVRLHTVYGGGPPPPFMFLGQILAALATNREFRMSPGTQLREYHHVEDDITAVRYLAESGARGVLDLSHGSPVALRDLAHHVFDQFGRLDLLRVGALPSPTIDNYFQVFERPATLPRLSFRDTLTGVVDYLRSCFHTVGECR